MPAGCTVVCRLDRKARIVEMGAEVIVTLSRCPSPAVSLNYTSRSTRCPAVVGWKAATAAARMTMAVSSGLRPKVATVSGDGGCG